MNRSGFYFAAALICCIMMLPGLSFGQQERTAFDEDFNWTDATEERTFYIDVKPGANQLKMDFEGKISQGSLNVTAYDPTQNKVAGFSLVCSGGVVREQISNGQNTHTMVHSGSGSNTTSTVTADGQSTVTVNTGSAEGTRKVKVKKKQKNRNKSKTKNGKSYSVMTTNSDARGAKGVMNKKITNPSPGKWKFVISVSDVSGQLEAEIEQ